MAEAAAAAHNRARREQGGSFEGLFQPLAAGGHDGGWTRTARSTVEHRPQRHQSRTCQITKGGMD